MTRASSARRILLWATMSTMSIGAGRSSARPPSPARPDPQVWAIAVGVGAHEDATIPGNRSAARDARTVRGWLQRAGRDRNHQLLLSDFGSADHGRPSSPSANILPTSANMQWAFEEWLIGKGEVRAKPGDVVVFYFAGGSRCTVDRRDGQVDSRHHLLLQDTDPKRVEATGFALEAAIDQCVGKGLRVVCWLATAPDGPAEAPRPTGLEWLARLARWPGVTAWLASVGPADGKKSDPGAVFTAAMLAALGDPAAAARRPNLAACLRDLQQDSRLGRQGFRSMGGVPPSMTVWPADLRPPSDPRPELVIQSGHADRVLAMAFPADGRLIATAAMDSTIRIWSAPDRMLLRVLAGHTVGATAMAITRDDRWLLTGGGRGTVLVFDRSKDFRPVPIRGAQPHAEGIRQLALLPDGLHFVTIDAQGRGFLWDPSQNPLEPAPFLDAKDIACRRVAAGGRAVGGEDTGFVAAIGGDGKIRVFDSSGRSVGLFDRPAPPDPETIAVSVDGRLLAVGYRDGTAIVHDRKAGTAVTIPNAGRPGADVPMELTFSPDGRLAVGSAGGLKLIGPIGAGEARVLDLLDRPIQHAAFSPNGGTLAACTAEGHALKVWRIDAKGDPTTLLDDPSAGAYHLGFTGNGRGLLIADNLGGLEYRPMDPDGPDVPWSFPAHRGKIQQLSASPSRQYLLFLDDQRPRGVDDRTARNARIWDLKERTCRLLPGAHAAGAFLDDNRIVLVPDSNAPEHAGRPILVDRDGNPLPGPIPADAAFGFKIPAAVVFDRIAVSPDGRLLAATASPALDPLVCVWETSTGRLIHWIASEKLVDPVLALAFSDEGRSLLTGGESEAARLWELPKKPGELTAPAATFEDPSVTSMITCLASRPGHPDEVATGHRDGLVHYWKRAGNGATLIVKRLVAGAFSTDVKAMAFTPDGKYLAVAGDGRRIWIGTLDPTPRRLNLPALPRVHHDEQVNALIAWPRTADHAGPMLVSGSDDTTIRFWDLAAGALRGTFSASSRVAGPAFVPTPEVDWVLYTPNGLYDASAEATKLVHYRRPARKKVQGGKNRADGPPPSALAVGVSRQEEAGQLDQLAQTHGVYGLGARLLQGLDPGQEPRADEAPPVAIAALRRNNPRVPNASLTISLGSDQFRDIRLYHNDVPIPPGWESGQPVPKSLQVPVKLVAGTNRFYAMASRDGTYDSISKVVELEYQAPLKRGRVHVVSLGVTAYPKRQLLYSRDDGERIGAILNQRGKDDDKVPGLRRSLYEKAITPASVNKAFRDIALAVEDRPQDTVVVFLAGHTGVFAPQRFCLLLPTYPFPNAAPPTSDLTTARDGGITAAERETVDPKFVLPYSTIEVNLSRLKALNRLVIVDACQAESIDDDPKVRAVRKWMEVASRRARTSYLMAARRGEPALEASPLQHGLFTFALLRGMQALGRDRLPARIAELKLLPNADFDGDRQISTDELDAYARQVVPKLAGVFRDLTVRGGVVTARGPAAKPNDQAVRLQAAESSFPLIPLD